MTLNGRWKNMKGQCIGITTKLKRCRRQSKFFLCADHKSPSYLYKIFLVIITVIGFLSACVTLLFNDYSGKKDREISEIREVTLRNEDVLKIVTHTKIITPINIDQGSIDPKIREIVAMEDKDKAYLILLDRLNNESEKKAQTLIGIALLHAQKFDIEKFVYFIDKAYKENPENRNIISAYLSGILNLSDRRHKFFNENTDPFGAAQKLADSLDKTNPIFLWTLYQNFKFQNYKYCNSSVYYSINKLKKFNESSLSCRYSCLSCATGSSSCLEDIKLAEKSNNLTKINDSKESIDNLNKQLDGCIEKFSKFERDVINQLKINIPEDQSAFENRFRVYYFLYKELSLIYKLRYEFEISEQYEKMANNALLSLDNKHKFTAILSNLDVISDYEIRFSSKEKVYNDLVLLLNKLDQLPEYELEYSVSILGTKDQLKAYVRSSIFNLMSMFYSLYYDDIYYYKVVRAKEIALEVVENISDKNNMIKLLTLERMLDLLSSYRKFFHLDENIILEITTQNDLMKYKRKESDLLARTKIFLKKFTEQDYMVKMVKGYFSSEDYKLRDLF